MKFPVNIPFRRKVDVERIRRPVNSPPEKPDASIEETTKQKAPFTPRRRGGLAAYEDTDND